MSENTLTRSGLYDLVWSESITSIANCIAVRPADVVKACAIANIPRPPNGYWMKLSYGKAPERPPLPPLGHGHLDTITIEGKPPRKKSVASKANVATAGNAAEEASTEVPKPAPVHKFVRQTEIALRGSRPSSGNGLVSLDHRTGPLFSVEVAKASVARALELLNQIVCVALDDGVELVELKGQYGSSVAFQASGETVALWIKEKLAREEIKPEDGGSRHWKDYKYTPTGHSGGG